MGKYFLYCIIVALMLSVISMIEKKNEEKQIKYGPPLIDVS